MIYDEEDVTVGACKHALASGARALQLRLRMPEDDALVGQVFEERYRIEGVLGRGAMGAVYRARHVKAAGREVAIKVLHAHLRARAGDARPVRARSGRSRRASRTRT